MATFPRLKTSPANNLLGHSDTNQTQIKMQNMQDYRKLYNSILKAFDAVNQTYYVIKLVYDEKGNAVDFIYEDVNSSAERLFGKKKNKS